MAKKIIGLSQNRFKYFFCLDHPLSFVICAKTLEKNNNICNQAQIMAFNLKNSLVPATVGNLLLLIIATILLITSTR